MLIGEDLVHRLGARMACVSPACAMATVRVARVAASSCSADRTVAAESSRSGTGPMMPMSGSSTSRWVLTVFGLEADHATPAARAMPVGLRVAALPGVIEVDAVMSNCQDLWIRCFDGLTGAAL